MPTLRKASDIPYHGMTGEVPENYLCEMCSDLPHAGRSERGRGAFHSRCPAQHLKINEAAEQLAKLDQQACPLCGITFYEFRHVGRLGCPHDYICFEEEIDPIISNIHSATAHVGKQPRSGAEGTDQRTDLIRLRREMEQAIEIEDYEKASQLRDQIADLEDETTG